MTTLLWHHEVHANWGKSRLCFLRVQFMPTYRAEVIDHVERSLQAAGVNAYAIYETFGSYDILVRCWVPTRIGVDDLNAHLHTDLRQHDVHTTDFMEVSDVLRHWSWVDAQGVPLPLDPSVHDWSSQQVLALDATKAMPEDQRSESEARAIADATRRQMLKPIDPGEGIRIFVALTPPIGSMPTPAGDALRAEVLRLAREAESEGISEWSAYAGHGFGTLLLIARVPNDRFYPVVRTLVNSIGSTGLAVSYRMRTFTAVAASPTFERFADRLSPPIDVRDVLTVREMLEQPESERLEFKGSAYADLGAYVRSGGSALEQNPKLLDSVVKTVCAYLNSEGGGSIVLGALEWAPFVAKQSHGRTDFAAEGGALLGEERASEGILLVGIDWDLRAVEKNWDGLSRQLQDAFTKRIQPHPLPWITFRTETVNGVSMACIDVRPMSRGWAYVVSSKDGKTDYRFYVREYGVTQEYDGPAADGYKQTSLRPD